MSSKIVDSLSNFKNKISDYHTVAFMVVLPSMVTSNYNPSNFIDFVGNKTYIACQVSNSQLQLTIVNNNVQLYFGDNATVYIYGIE